MNWLIPSEDCELANVSPNLPESQTLHSLRCVISSSIFTLPVLHEIT